MADQVNTYHGSCECGAFAYELSIPDIKRLMECNCSLCVRKAYSGIFCGPQEQVMKVLNGSMDQLYTYAFGDKTLEHKFCGKCGTPLIILQPQAPPEYSIGFNARTLKDVDISNLERKTVNGASLGGTRMVHEYGGVVPHSNIEGGKVYTGSCHCGAQRLAVDSKPLDNTDEDNFRVCTCSHCSKNGLILSYPADEAVGLQLDQALLGDYKSKLFCKTCGVCFAIKRDPSAINEQDEAQHHFTGPYGINLRVLDGVDLEALSTH